MRTIFTLLYYKISSDLSAVYYDYFAALTQTIHAPCSTDEIGGIRSLPTPVTPQEPMVVLMIRRLLTLKPPSHPLPTGSVRSIRSYPTSSKPISPIIPASA